MNEFYNSITLKEDEYWDDYTYDIFNEEYIDTLIEYNRFEFYKDWFDYIEYSNF